MELSTYASFHTKKLKEKMQFTKVWSLMLNELRGFYKLLSHKKLGDFCLQNALKTGSERDLFVRVNLRIFWLTTYETKSCVTFQNP